MSKELTQMEVNISVDLSALKELEMVLEDIKGKIKEVNATSITDIIGAGTNVVNMGVGIANLVISLKSSKKNIGSEFEALKKLLENSEGDVSKAFKAIARAMGEDLCAPLKDTLSEVKNTLSSMADTMESQAKNLGECISEGVSKGLKSGLKDVKMRTEELGEDGVIKEFESTMEIKSPSKVMKKMGGYISEGLGDGIKAGAKSASKAMDGLSDSVLDSAKDLNKIEKEAKGGEKAMDKYGKAAKSASKTKFSMGGIAAVAAIVGALVGFFVNLISTNEELSGKMEKIWGRIKDAFQPVIDAVSAMFDAFTTGAEGTGSVMDTIVEVIGGVATFIGEIIGAIVGFFQENSETIGAIVGAVWGVISGIIETAKEIFATVFGVIVGFFEEHGDTIMGVVTKIWGFIESIIEGAKNIIGGIIDIIVGIFTGNGEKIKEGFGKIWEGIKGIFGGIGEFFSGIWDKVVAIFKKVGTKIGDAIGGAFKAVVNTILDFAEGIINGFIKAINFAIKMINVIPGVSIKKLDLLVIPKLASGGLLDPGQMFIAREAGPELVGSFGSKTAVMNNNQIVESVSRGVYDAVRSAMGNGNGQYTFNISNHLDGKEIGKQVVKYHNGIVKQTGASPLFI